MKRMTPVIHTSLENFDFDTPHLIEVVHSMVAVEIVRLEECENCVDLPGGWPQQIIGLQV